MTLFVVAQQPEYIAYGSKDGMLSNDCYRVLEDSKGFIWVYSEKGVMKYDGYEFKPFTIDNGLPSNDIWYMQRDFFGRLWVNSFAPGAYYFENDEVKRIEKADSTYGLVYLTSKQDSVFFCGYADERNYYYCWSTDSFGTYGNQEGRILMSDSTFKNQVIQYKGVDDGARAFYLGGQEVYRIPSEKVIRNSRKYVYNTQRFKVGKDSIVYGIITDSSFNILDNLGVDSERFDFVEGIGYVVSSIDTFMVFSDVIAGTRDFELEDRLSDLHSEYWDLNVYQDREKNNWVILPRIGLFFFPNNSSMVEDLPFNKVVPTKNMVDIGGSLIITDCDYETYSFSKKGQTSESVYSFPGSYHEEISAGKKVYFRKTYSESYLFTEIDVSNNEISTKEILTSKDKLIFVSSSGLSIDSAVSLQKFKDLLSDKSADFAASIKFLSVPKSLTSVKEPHAKIINDTEKYFVSGRWNAELRNIEDNELLASFDFTDITDATFTKDGLIICTNGRGLLYYDFEGNLLDKKYDGICINGLSYYNDTAYFATNQGLYVETVKSDKLTTIKSIGYDHGLSSNDIQGVIYDDSVLYVLSNYGVDRITLSELWNRVDQVPLFYLNSIAVNDKMIDIDQGPAFLESSENNIRFDFIGLYYRNPGTLLYEYQLKGHESVTMRTSDLSVEYSQLPPGDYEFVIKAVNGLGAASEPISYKFSIEPHLFDKTWFRVLVISVIVLLSLAILYVIQSRRQLRKQQRIERKKRLADLELKALRSQMNPHFVFNSLSSIQSVMFLRGEEEANEYITDFSDLIRKTLDNSKAELITLNDEFNYLKLYIELEKRRLNNKLDFEIIISDELNPDAIQLNAMMIQPLVENAIIHGLAPLKTKRRLRIEASLEEGFLKIVVEDNGVGRKETLGRASSGVKHQSWASTILSERIETLNSMEKKNITSEIIDLENNGEPSGTRVIIKIPLENEN